MMRAKPFPIALCLISIFILPGLVSAQDDTQFKKRKLRYHDQVLAQSSGEVSQKSAEIAPAVKPFNIPEYLHFRFNSILGYDTNPRFTSPKKSDGFAEQTFAVAIDLPIERLGSFFAQDKLAFAYELDAVNYFKNTQVNIFDQTFAWTWTRPLVGPVEMSARYMLDLYRFPDSNRLTFMGNNVELGLTWKGHYIQHGPRYLYLHRNFDKQKEIGDNGVDGAKDRQDNLNNLQYEFLISLWNKVFLQHTQETFMQRTNDHYQRFNEFSGYRTTSALTTQRIYRFQPIARFGYERRNYRQRTNTATSDKMETDDYFFWGASLFYALTPYADLGFNFLNRQNNSNSPAQDYFSNQMTWGLYTNF